MYGEKAKNVISRHHNNNGGKHIYDAIHTPKQIKKKNENICIILKFRDNRAMKRIFWQEAMQNFAFSNSIVFLQVFFFFKSERSFKILFFSCFLLFACSRV